MYGIHEKVYKRIMEYFKKNDQINKVVLFGSRATNKATKESDIDLCIDYIGDTKGEVVDAINEKAGLYSCDIVLCNELNKEIKDQINRDGITIYEKQ
ncbi:nucleotidyltransferase domain-containing protein [Sediminibacillus sp. JSM 1682029]|uniref:nucleotidyltransferase domain-containing protein n=1 Tax=Sediminibacillus sp. JSM 1682029 TaxID=3229857 RepID=UPI00040B8669